MESKVVVWDLVHSTNTIIVLTGFSTLQRKAIQRAREERKDYGHSSGRTIPSTRVIRPTKG